MLRTAAALILALQTAAAAPAPQAPQGQAEAVAKAAPPRRKSADAPPVSVYCGEPDQWSGSILHGLPSMVAVGRKIFGAALPATRFYLFPERPAFDRFFRALNPSSTQTSWQDATGLDGLVVACGRDAGGKISRPHGDPETDSCVFHEFGHAWMSSYAAAHGKTWRWADGTRSPVIDEGLSDWAAAQREPAFLARRADWVKLKVSSGVPAPGFDELLSYDAFYKHGDIDLHYWLSGLLMDRLLDGDAGRFTKILDAQSAKKNADAALKAATGKDARAEYADLVRGFWRPDAH